ncbi:MAG: MBL fold metallo-hydrolase [Myxococcales bacterium]|nr:MBL fold metallo-hydrolase [Myxococcales bacterium]MCB9643891.1 MBL fold metallo-hydrolase [Myxococcales bacterium]
MYLSQNAKPANVNIEIETFYDPATYTLTFVVFDPKTKDTVVIDPVMDYEPGASSTSTESVDEVSKFIKDKGLNLHYVLETHAHADHLSGSQLLKERFGAKVAIGEHIQDVQALFKGLFDLPADFNTDGRQFDKLLADDEVFEVGSLKIKTIYTPGHTPACVSYLIEDAVFTGDSLFMDDYGTGRCDFPGGNAKDMYNSIHNRLYSLPDDTRVFVGHDYQPTGREVLFETTIGKSKLVNPQLSAATTEEQFVNMREARDRTLAAPKLLFQSVQVNIDAGNLPIPSNANEVRYLKIPVNIFRGAEQQGVTDGKDLEEATV